MSLGYHGKSAQLSFIDATLLIAGGIEMDAPAALTTTATITEAQSSLVFEVTQSATPFTITLPTPRLGLSYTFVMSTASSGAVTVTPGGALLRGVRIDTTATLVVTAQTNLLFANAAVLGDRMHFTGYAGFYSVATYSGANGGITSS